MDLNGMIIAIGLIGGISMGLTGVGAGSVINSLLLVLVPGLPLPLVVGSSAVQGTLIKLLVSHKEFTLPAADRNQVGWMIIGAIPATVIGSSFLLQWLSQIQEFRLLLYMLLAITSIVIVVEALAFRKSHPLPEDADSIAKRSPWLLFSWGSILGAIVGATTIGTGSLMVTTLLMVLKFPVQRSVSLSLWAGGIILFIAAGMHILQGHVDWPLLGNLMLGSTPGIFLGKYLRSYLPGTALRISVAVLIFYLMSQNLLKFL